MLFIQLFVEKGNINFASSSKKRNKIFEKIGKITSNKLNIFYKDLIIKSEIHLLNIGNILPEGALSFSRDLISSINSKNKTSKKKNNGIDKPIKLPFVHKIKKGHSLYRFQNSNPSDTNHLYISYF